MGLRVSNPISVFDIARRFIGIKEVSGTVDNPQIMSMLNLDMDWPEHDEVPWCSAFTNYICWLWSSISPSEAPLPRSKSLRARSWLAVGEDIGLDNAKLGDIVVLKRGQGDQPGPEVLNAPGHVGFYAGRLYNFVKVLGGNQSDTVKISRYPANRVLGIRRLT